MSSRNGLLDKGCARWYKEGVDDLILEHVVTSYECGADHLLKPECFMMLCQEMAECHAEKHGFGFDWGFSHHVIWVEVQANFEFVQRPKWKEKVLLRTNTGVATPFKARRFVEMTTPAGEVLGRADMYWALIDITSRGPVALKKVGLDMVGACPAITAPLQRQAWDSPAESSPEFPAPKRDVDFNGHINNSAYLIWALEHDAQPLPACPFAYQLKFKHETMAGEPVRVDRQVQGSQRRYLVVGDTLRAEVLIEAR